MKRLWSLLMRLCRRLLSVLYRIMGMRLSDERWLVWEQFIKFVLVGASNTVVLLAVYYLVVLLLGERYYLFGQTLGYAAGIMNSFFWNKRYVFSGSHQKTGVSFVKMCVCYAFTYFIQIGILFIFVDVLYFSELLSPILAIIFTTPINFFLNRMFAF